LLAEQLLPFSGTVWHTPIVPAVCLDFQRRLPQNQRIESKVLYYAKIYCALLPQIRPALTLKRSTHARPSHPSKSRSCQSDDREKVDFVELGWKLSHSNFSEILQQMQHLMQLISESHVSQLLSAHRSVQKEKIMRILVEAQLQERDEIQAAHDEAYKLLNQNHQILRQRYIELCSCLNMYASSALLFEDVYLFNFA
jgi:hypothetical protein